MSAQTNEIKNENLNVQFQREPGSLVKLVIEVSPKATHAAYQQALKNINKEISIPGFRKGKAPTSFILEKYAKPLEQEWKELLLNTTFRESLGLIKIYPFDDNSVRRAHIEKIDLEDGAKVLIDFEAIPEIPHIDIEGLSLKPIHQKEITEKDIEETIEVVRLHHAEWQEIVDRSVQEGDWIDLDIQNAENPEESYVQNGRFKVEHKKIGEWLRKLVLGKNVNDVLEAMSEKEEAEHSCDACEDEVEGHHHEEFKPTLCKVTIKGIKNPHLPELNEEFAKKVGAQSIEDLRTKVENTLKQREERHVKNRLRHQLESQLLKKYPFEVPQSLIEKDKKNRTEYRLSQMGSSDEQTRKDIESQVENELKEAFQLLFLTRKIAQENQISVSNEEVMQEFMQQMISQDSEEKIVDQSMDSEEIRSRLFSYLLTRKAKDFLLEKIKEKSA